MILLPTDSKLELIRGNTVGLCLVFCLLLSGSLTAAGVPYQPQEHGSGPFIQEEVETFEMTFELEGRAHREFMQVGAGGNLLRVADAGDGFEATIDHERGLALIKNTTSSECYFTSVGNIPELRAGNGQYRALLVSQDRGPLASVDSVLLHVSGRIPTGFVGPVTGPIMSRQCSGVPSNWLESPTVREKRGLPDGVIHDIADILWVGATFAVIFG